MTSLPFVMFLLGATVGSGLCLAVISLEVYWHHRHD